MEEFNAYDYASDRYPETLNFMSEDELSDLDLCENENENDVIEYMMQFHERT